jgi:hypothetical protein
MQDNWFGRVYKEDERDLQFTVSSITDKLSNMPDISQQEWWSDGWKGNQGNTPLCVSYAWSHWFEDGPVIQDSIIGRPKPVYNTKELYDAFREFDGLDGDYAGTTVRAGAKVFQKLGIVSEYRWALTLEDVINAVTYIGPMVAGTRWTERMNDPTSKQFIIKPGGKTIGGHAYLINGVDTDKELFRIKNSWGTSWGNAGQAYIRFSDFERLLHDQGEACVAFENEITEEVPDLDKLRD